MRRRCVLILHLLAGYPLLGVALSETGLLGTTTAGRVTLKLPNDEEIPAISVPVRTGNANLMLPPVDQLDLCPEPYPRQLQDQLVRRTSIRPQPQGKYGRGGGCSNCDESYSVAALVSPDGCSIQDKATTAFYYQKTMESDLQYVIVPGIDSPADEMMSGVQVPNDATFLGLSRAARVAAYGDLNYIFVNSTYWNVISKQLHAEKDRSGTRPFIGNRTTDDWNFRLEILSSDVDEGQVFILIFAGLSTLGLITGCCVTLLCVYGRTTGARIVGEETTAAADVQVVLPGKRKLLTREEVLALPEIIYPAAATFFHEPSVSDQTTTRIKDELGPTSTSIATEALTDDSHCCLPVTEAESNAAEYGTGTSSLSMCPICIHDYEDGERLRMLPACQHVFHTECILPWLSERQSYCPYCKTEVCATSKDLQESASGDETSLSSPSSGASDDGPSDSPV